MRRALILAIIACVPSDRSVEHALLDRGYDSIRVRGWAPACAPRRGAVFEARSPVSGEAVTGRVCCAVDRFECEVVTP